MKIILINCIAPLIHLRFVILNITSSVYYSVSDNSFSLNVEFRVVKRGVQWLFVEVHIALTLINIELQTLHSINLPK